MKKNQHVVKYGNSWAVKGAGNEKVTKVTATQKQAIEVAIKIAKNNRSEVVIHGRNGQIRDKDSYGNDPIYYRDKKF
ncbi:DUF2188 domain-containing protein [Niabella aurantiaca]|uniref:DUF2188 domain-containing protein n=1 Tax=Niabella aurantiaca TaxID=379900 RepID=UPI00037C7C8D|nr:DUF2188 domain-containing protein [Niabella aurantiaca]